jgi:hypothetical protein
VTENNRSITDGLGSDGYVFLSKWRVDQSTFELAQLLGTVIDIPSILKRPDIPIVQTLKPYSERHAPRNGYSRAFGLGEFPFHTDLAHWVRPPPYFMLRCRRGSPSVSTQLIQFSDVECKLDYGLIARALVRSRKHQPNGTNCLLPVRYVTYGSYAFRWDSLFLIPMTRSAKRLSIIMSTTDWPESFSVSLVHPGDTLIVDNRRLLHRRTSVSPSEADRRIERVYFSEVHT